MSRWSAPAVYLLFFLSGAAALTYQVAWVRSLSLVFGGSHLAVTTVLAVYMGGLALGGWLLGRRVERIRSPLALYGVLELGIAATALASLGLVALYPRVYAPLASGLDGSIGVLTALRVLFAIAALLVPTTLMGGTLPVLSRLAAGGGARLRRRLSFLYGWNTLGAVLGAVAAGFVLLPALSLGTTVRVAAAVNAAIGLAALALRRPLERGAGVEEPGEAAPLPPPPAAAAAASPFAARLVLAGIGVSGFCALGYEVLWTRTLTMVVGASVYGFTTMLAAFLAGIALGSEAYGLLPARRGPRGGSPGRAVAAFGLVQLGIGGAALLATALLRDLPQVAIRVRSALSAAGLEHEAVRPWAGFAVAFLYMLVPAFLMGVAFPLAGEVHARARGRVASAVGEVLAWNTAGAILGSAVSGFVLVYALGAERSLQLLCLANAGVGAACLLAARSRGAAAAALAATAAAMALLAGNPAVARVWDTRLFAVYRNNQVEAFRTPGAIREALENTEVLHYAEGADANISAIRVKGGQQAVLVNGKVVASTDRKDLQCEYALGHLPMLLHPDPRSVLVVGLGTGITLGAAAAHPSVRELVLVEIEPRTAGAARTFDRLNHSVLDDPRLELVHADGRNYLLTTERRFDVITADPIHPWAQGAAYLYTDEYFALAASRLAPGGVMCQWLPIYELTAEDLRTVAATFARHFRHVYAWLTHNDAELVGSNDPISLDLARIQGRLDASPAVRADLASVEMGSARDLLAYAIMGDAGLRSFAAGAAVNTDDNLRLEFSAPLSAGKFLIPGNLHALYASQEPLFPELFPAEARALQARAHERLTADRDDPAASALVDALRARFPDFAPGRFLEQERAEWAARQPALIAGKAYPVVDGGGRPSRLSFAAVWAPVSRTRGSVAFVDDARRVVLGERYFDGAACRDAGDRYAAEVLEAVDAEYARARAGARGGGPAEADVLAAIERVIAARGARRW